MRARHGSRGCGMAGRVAHHNRRGDADTLIRQIHRLVTQGPWDLEIAFAMSVYGYDAVKWAEGECVLAELVSGDRPRERHLVTATDWYNEAVTAAQSALVARPRLLDKLGVTEAIFE
jgi:hypothetical protein